jgi:DNA-binding winged helix-turn-helix (wHTH) protein
MAVSFILHTFTDVPGNRQGFTSFEQPLVRITFSRFTVDSGRRQLIADGQEILLSPKAFDLLWLLIERRPNVVGKATLMDRIWPDVEVVDANLAVLISEIRKALSDSPQQQLYIRTAARIGYAFCGDVAEGGPQPHLVDRRETASRFWLATNEKTYVLADGFNVIGRDPTCHVCLDGSGVSRRHATIHIDSSTRRATLEDSGSTNGTFLRRTRVDGRTHLTDGDVIDIGDVELTFRMRAGDNRPTERIVRKRS